MMYILCLEKKVIFYGPNIWFIRLMRQKRLIKPEEIRSVESCTFEDNCHRFNKNKNTGYLSTRSGWTRKLNCRQIIPKVFELGYVEKSNNNLSHIITSFKWISIIWEICILLPIDSRFSITDLECSGFPMFCLWYILQT